MNTDELRMIRFLFSNRPTTTINSIYPTEIAYADDIDFISTSNYRNIERLLAKFDLVVNKDKKKQPTKNSRMHLYQERNGII